MKYEITKIETGKSVIIEATSKAAALKQAISTRNGKITVARKADWKDNVYSAGVIGCFKFERNFYTVTEVATETVEVVEVAEVVEATTEVVSADYITEGNIDAVMMTYSNERLMDIVATHSLRNSKVDRILTEAAARELAGR